jgi:hypothetical protein
VCGNPDHKLGEVPACKETWRQMAPAEQAERRKQYGMGPKQGEGRGPARGRH